jgi:hypothetical protein
LLITLCQRSPNLVDLAATWRYLPMEVAYGQHSSTSHTAVATTLPLLAAVKY